MALTFEQLETLLTPSAGTLRVGGAALQTPLVQVLFDTYLTGGRLDLLDATAVSDPATRAVTVDGTLADGTFLGLEGAEVPAARFQLLADGSVHARVEVSVTDEDWQLPASFDALAGTVLEQAKYADAGFVLDSAAPDVLPPGFREDFGYPKSSAVVTRSTVRGLSFHADLTFTGEIARNFALLFTAPVGVAGPIESYVDSTGSSGKRLYPQFLLKTTTDSGRKQKVGNYDLRFDLQVAGPLIEIPDDAGTEVGVAAAPLLAVITDFPAPAGQPAIRISSYLYQEAGGRLVFNVGSSLGRGGLNASDLPALLAGTTVAPLLKPGGGFPVVNAITLERLSLELGLSPLALEAITLEVTLGKKQRWSLLGVMDLNRIGLTLAVLNRGGKYVPMATATAGVSFGPNKDVGLEAAVSLPDLDFSVVLTQATTLDLTELVETQLGIDLDLPAITGGFLLIAGNVKEKRYELEAELDQTWTIAGTPQNGLVLGKLNLGARKDPSGVSASLTAELGLAGVQLVVMATRASDGAWAFSGESAPGQIVNLTRLLGELTAVFGLQLPPGIPEIDLTELRLAYDKPAKKGEQGSFTLQASVAVPAARLDLTKLPLVGEHLDAGEVIALDAITVVVGRTEGKTTAELTMRVKLGAADSVEVVIPLKREQPPPLLEGPAENRLLPVRRRANLPAPYEPGGSLVFPEEGSGLFISVQRAFGPVRIEKVGFTLEQGGLGVQVYGSLTISSLTVAVEGLEIVIPLREPYVPQFDIRGLSVRYDTPGLKIAGGLLKVTNPSYLQFDGFLVVSAQAFSISALASFATSAPPSLFAFAFLSLPIGGPPFFFVTGAGGGFGVNRSLELPPIEKVAEYPLVTAAQKNPFPPNAPLSEYIASLDKWIKVAIGQNWLAAGIRFTTFKTVESFALLTVAFGTRFQIGLLGISTLTIPPAATPTVAEARLALRAMFDPQLGSLEIDALLTPDSYVLSKDCHLTGGFGFYMWFTPTDPTARQDLAGDFVVTLGGYNPYYKVPAHYPDVPRLGFNWRVTNQLVLKGGMYLALTPRCVMAGGFLDGTWQTSGGGIKASFGVYADFLVAWRPFFYDARVRANFSVVATIEWLWTWTLSVSVGADLHIWGPEFSGTAYINLSVISFTIPFGNANQNGPPPIHWSEFRTSFLGERGSVVRTMVSAGLLKTLEPAKARVDPEQLVLYAQTLVPAKKLSLNSSDLPETWKKDFGVGPMALAPDAVTSEIAVTVKRDGVEDGGLLATAVRKPAPVALWRYEPSLMAQLSAPALLQNIAQGVELKPPAAEARHSLAVDVAALGHVSEVTVRCEWGADPAPAGDPFGHLKPWTTLTETIGDARVAAARADVVSALYFLEFGVSPDIDVAPLEQRDLLGLLDPPQLSLLGEDKEPAVL